MEMVEGATCELRVARCRLQVTEAKFPNNYSVKFSYLVKLEGSDGRRIHASRGT